MTKDGGARSWCPGRRETGATMPLTGTGGRGSASSTSMRGSSGPLPTDFKLVESDAADVAQTTWLRLLEHIDRIEYPDRVGSWLAATARNECLRSLAARKRVVLANDDVELDLAALSDRSPKLTSAFSPMSALRSFATPCLACPGAGSGCSRCSWPIRRFPTPNLRRAGACRSAASVPLGGGAWPGYACCCRLHEPSASASTHRLPDFSTSGNAWTRSAGRS